MKIAAVQYKPPKSQPVQARKEILDLATEAASAGAELIVFPEMATSGYLFKNRNDIIPYTELSDGPLVQSLMPVARSYKAWIIAGFPELGKDGMLHNAACIISDTGTLAATYRKTFLYEADTTWAHAGNERLLLHTSHGRIFPGICMDLNDNGFIDAAHASEAEIIPFCTNWIEEGIDVWSYWQMRLSGFTGCFIAANTWGIENEIEFSGRTAIFGNGMQCLAHAEKTGNQIVYADIAVRKF